MPQKPNKISQFWQELKRRRVVDVITVYASASFVLIELVNNLSEPLNLPPRLSTIVVIILAVGFPLAVILAWIYDLTPEGIEKTKSPEEALKQSQKALEFDPDNDFAVGTLADANLALGDTTEWYKIWKTGLWWTTPSYLDSLDPLFADGGYMAVIRDRIRINEEVLASGGYFPFSGLAKRYLIIGEFDRGMDLYRKAIVAGDGLVSYAALDHLAFPELKNYPDYLALLKELNLPPPGTLPAN